MQSASSNARYPGVTGRINDRYISNNIAAADQLRPDQVRLWSHQDAALMPGKYTIKANHTLKADADKPELGLQELVQEIDVPGPQLKLHSIEDIHSVYPPPGESAPANTLAHVVLNQPAIPWERELTNSNGSEVNKLPWLGVLSFSEDDLLLTPEAVTAVGFERNIDPSRFGTVATRVETLQSAKIKTFTASPMNSESFRNDYGVEDSLEVLLLRRSAFEQIFKPKAPVPGKKPSYDLSPFASMVHVRETHGGFTAVTDAQNPQLLFSTVISPRTAPTDITAPTRVISHLVALEGIEDLKMSDQTVVALVSLHAWDWMCTTVTGPDPFIGIMNALGHAVQPLRVPDSVLKDMVDPKAGLSKENGWLEDKLKAGFTLLDHTNLTGAKNKCLFRGPLIPVMDNAKLNMWSLGGEKSDLAQVDSATGLEDLSYLAAWRLGQALALSDRPFNVSLARLRGKLKAESLKQAKAQAQQQSYPMDKFAYIQNLSAAISDIIDAHKATNIQKANMTTRWYRSPDEQKKTPQARLAESSRFQRDAYLDQVEKIAPSLFGVASSNLMDVDPDALAVRKWIVDKFFLAGIPLFYLVTNPDNLPRETLRTFCIDSNWIDALIDGSLSLSNHCTDDDDPLRREIKNAMNTWLRTPLRDTPSKGTLLQAPRWGFLMRSTAVTAFPNLKVEAPLKAGTPDAVNEVLYMQVIADDVLICLFDRVPGEEGFSEIIIRQPSHQQTYCLGTELTSESLKGVVRLIPASPTVSIGSETHGKVSFVRDGNGRCDVYDWESRMMEPQEYGRYAVKEMEVKMTELEKKQPGMSKNFFKCSNTEQVPSSVLATQLGRTLLRLKLNIVSATVDTPYREPSCPIQLSVRPRKKVLTKSLKVKSDESLVRSPPAYIKLSEVIESGTKATFQEAPTIQTNPPSTSPETLFADSPFEVLEQYPTRLWHRPMQVYFCDQERGYSPDRAKYKPSLQYKPGPTNILCNLEDTPTFLNQALRTNAQTIEIRFPISLCVSETVPGLQTNSPGLFSISGFVKAPNLPRIYPLNYSNTWRYTVRLAIGTLWGSANPGRDETHMDKLVAPPQHSPEETKILLIVTAHNRFPERVGEEKHVDASFILQGVEVWSGVRDGSVFPVNVVFDGSVGCVQSVGIEVTRVG